MSLPVVSFGDSFGDRVQVAVEFVVVHHFDAIKDAAELAALKRVKQQFENRLLSFFDGVRNRIEQAFT
jgi:hypothetical protein